MNRAPEPRSADKRIARLALVLDEDPLKPGALDRIEPLREAADDPTVAQNAPYSTPVRRLDEAGAAKRPVIRQPL